MLDDKIDVGEADEIETEIDLDAVAPEQSLEEEKIYVEEISEDSVESNNAPAESDEQPNVQADKEELGEYSEGVKKRIAKLTRKMREAERQKEEAINYAQSIYKTTQTQKSQLDNLSGHYTTELEAKVANGLDAAKLAYRAAIEAKDVDAQIAAQQAIAQMTMEESKLKNVQASRASAQARQTEQETKEYQAPRAPTKQDIYQAAQEIDPKAEDWSSKNKWFGTDNAMTYTAFDIHRKLVEDEGFDASTNEYYVEVDRRIRLEFPHKFGTIGNSTSAPVQNVAGARRPANNTGRRKTVKLTPSQVAISKRLGVPLEEYAKQLTAKEV
jgi:hypothetical protein